MEEQKKRERKRRHRKRILPEQGQEQDQEQNLENSSEKRAASPAARSYAKRSNEELRQRFLVRKVSSDRGLYNFITKSMKTRVVIFHRHASLQTAFTLPVR